MTSAEFAYGFRVLGDARSDRKLVPWQAAFEACAECAPSAHTERESYLSAYCFADDFRKHLKTIGSPKAFSGPTWTPWLWFDIDREPSAGGIPTALNDSRRLSTCLVERYGVDPEGQLWFYSGSKGFHCGIPTGLWNPEPSLDFHKITKRIAETIAKVADIIIDSSVYDAVRLFRAPNSRHGRTGRHKIRLTTDEIMGLSPDSILKKSENPEPFEIPEIPKESTDFLVAHWDQAAGLVRAEAVANAERATAITNGLATARLNRATREFIVNGAKNGDRHRMLYSSAANLAELGASFTLAYELLAEPALDSGLPPAEVKRQIECGLAGGTKKEMQHVE